MSEEIRQNKGRGLIDRKVVEALSNFIAGRPKAALLLWFFSGFRCGVWVYIVPRVRHENRKEVFQNRCLMLDKPVTTCMGNGCSPGYRCRCL